MARFSGIDISVHWDMFLFQIQDMIKLRSISDKGCRKVIFEEMIGFFPKADFSLDAAHKEFNIRTDLPSKLIPHYGWLFQILKENQCLKAR